MYRISYSPSGLPEAVASFEDVGRSKFTIARMAQTVNIIVHEVHWSTGAFEHYVVFDAEIELRQDSTNVDIVNVEWKPKDAEPRLLETAVARIREGVAAVLQPKGLGANVRLSNLFIHPVDFVDFYF